MKNLPLASKLLIVQLTVLTLGALTLVGTAFLVAPGLFSHHLAYIGDNSPELLLHINEAFISAISQALFFAGIASLAASSLIGWVFMRRIANPIEELADAADKLARRDYPVQLPTGGFSRELRKLNEAFERMAGDLQLSEARRVNLLADLAHELRTPLATLNAYIDGLEDGVVVPEAQSWQVLRLQIARMNRLVEDLKSASASDEHSLSMNFQLTDIGVVISSVVAIFSARCEIEEKVLRYNKPPKALMVNADAERLQQVLMNLLDNAARHSQGGDVIEVSLREVGDGVEIEVSDSGEGIDQEHIELVFERFFRADPSRKTNETGSGLGLTIARSVIELHSGRIKVESPGRLGGATFTIVIPKFDHE